MLFRSASESEVGEAYYSGDDYQNYEEESRAVQSEVTSLLARNAPRGGAVLDVGCATGDVLAALQTAGWKPTGVDVSEWAVNRARTRLGDVVFQGDVNARGTPDEVRARGPFDAIVLANVLEHFSDPAAVLAGVAALAAPDACLIILTTNADSLSHRLFGGDWEGPFDWTHRSVDLVSASWLRTTLVSQGWRVAELETWHYWHAGDDPAYTMFRDWLGADARFRLMLGERDLGDLVRCVAVRGRV